MVKFTIEMTVDSGEDIAAALRRIADAIPNFYVGPNCDGECIPIRNANDEVVGEWNVSRWTK